MEKECSILFEQNPQFMHYMSHMDDVSHIMWLLYDANKAMQMQLNSFLSQWKKYGCILFMKTCKKPDDM